MSRNEEVLHVKTVIIGAGMAGISASVNLLANGYDDFVVFEAIERIGGRFHTMTNEDGYLEIGAQWIHGQVGNPLYEVALKNNLLADGYERIQDESERVQAQDATNLVRLGSVNKDTIYQDIVSDKTIFPTQNGHKINSQFAQGIYDLVTKIISMAESLPTKGPGHVDNRVGDFLFDKFNEIVDAELNDLNIKATGLSKSELKRLMCGIFLMRCKRENIRSGTGNIFDLSLRNFSTYKEFKGFGYVELKKGFGPVVDAIISDHKEAFHSRVRLNHYLKKIYLSSPSSEPSSYDLYPRPNVHSKYTDDPKKAVLVICDRTNPQEPKDLVVVCENVISTMSLGYLKENVNSFLEPLSYLSDEKRTAISRLGFGTINKIFLFYDQPFWGDHVELINMIWLPEDDGENATFRVDKMRHVNDVTPVWQEQICKFEVVRSQAGRKCLSAWIAGSEYFEKLDETTIGQECTKLLRRFLANDTIPEPKSVLRTKWNSHKFVRGSYCSLPLGSSPKDIEVLAKPIPSEQNPILMFAGEASHPDYFSTMHGAYLTGIRESNRLLKLRKNES